MSEDTSVKLATIAGIAIGAVALFTALYFARNIFEKWWGALDNLFGK